MSYDDVSVTNSTPFTIRGTVFYAACENDGFTDLRPGQTWKHSRGLCLITSIWATVETDKGDVGAKTYESSGTSYSQFAVAMYQGDYVVTRVVTTTSEQEPEHIPSAQG
jgi:hypothetical protein